MNVIYGERWVNRIMRDLARRKRAFEREAHDDAVICAKPLGVLPLAKSALDPAEQFVWIPPVRRKRRPKQHDRMVVAYRKNQVFLEHLRECAARMRARDLETGIGAIGRFLDARRLDVKEAGNLMDAAMRAFRKMRHPLVFDIAELKRRGPTVIGAIPLGMVA